MPQVSFPAVPINGGSISLNTENGHVCRLSGLRYISVCTQFTPQYTIGSVVTLNNAKSTTPSVTMLRQQVIPNLNIGPSSSQAGVRLIRLTDNSVLVIKSDTANYLLKTFNVLYIDPTTNEITTKLATDVNFYTQATSWGFNTNGIAITAINESDNSVLIAYRTASNQAKIGRAVYDPNANTLTFSELSTFAIHTGTPSIGNLQIVKTPNGVIVTNAVGITSSRLDLAGINKMFYVASGSNTVTTIFDETYSSTTVQNRRKSYVPFTDTTGVFTDGMYMQAFTNGVLGQSISITNAGGPSVYLHCSHALKMTDEYFTTLTVYFGGSVTTDNLSNVSRGFRVVKYTDPNYSICSPATVGTTSQAGVTITAPAYWFPEMPMMDLVDSQLIVMPVIVNSNSFGFKTLWVS